jgi:hypothetical protein
VKGKGRKGRGGRKTKKFNNGNRTNAPFIFLFIKSREKTKY